MGSINCVEMSLNVGAPIDILFNGCNVSMHDVHVCERHLKLDDKNRSRVLSRLSVIRAFVQRAWTRYVIGLSWYHHVRSCGTSSCGIYVSQCILFARASSSSCFPALPSKLLARLVKRFRSFYFHPCVIFVVYSYVLS